MSITQPKQTKLGFMKAGAGAGLPHAHLEIDFADDVDINIPKYQISEKFAVATSIHRWEKTKLVVSGKMSVDSILEIAGHEKVVKIMGYANASHY